MNYAMFAEFVRGIEEDLITRFGLTRSGARRIACRLEIDSINDYNENRDRNQLILEYRELGPIRLAERMNVSRDTVRRRYVEAIAAKAQKICGTG